MKTDAEIKEIVRQRLVQCRKEHQMTLFYVFTTYLCFECINEGIRKALIYRVSRTFPVF